MTLSSATVEDQTLTASVTYKNAGVSALVAENVAIEVIGPDATVSATLEPPVGPTIIEPGAAVQVVASRTFTDADAEGTWQAYSVFRSASGVRIKGRSLFFFHKHHRPKRDAGLTPLPVDAGVMPVDAGVTPVPEPVDAGVTPAPEPVDAGVTPAPEPVDAGVTPVPVPVDAGVTPVPVPVPVDAGVVTPPAGAIVEPVSPGAGQVSFVIRADSDVHPISPLIYGVNQVRGLTTTQRGVGLVRAGGNRWTAYNWETNASNAGIDYQNQNDAYLMQGFSNVTTPGEAVRVRTANALANGAAMMVTVPIQGYVAADMQGNGDVNQSSNYLQTRFKQTVARKNAAFSLSPNTSDGVVYQDEFVNWLKTQYPTSFNGASSKILISLDNEPDLWSDSHPRIQPSMVTSASLISKTIEFASAVKSVIPTALVTGFVSYGYYGFATLQGGYSGDFTAHFLTQLRVASASANTRLLDVLDLHWYPEATGDGQRITGTSTSAGSVTARVQAPRSLWDPTYTETSWVANAEGGPIQLIPKMKARIAANYPGTKLGFTEYSYGGGAHISGAIAQADVLGIFGREDVYLANFWELNEPTDFIYAGMRAFTSFDEAGAHFGDTSVRASSSNVTSTSVYASIDASNRSRMVIVAINKTGAPVTASLSLAAYGTYSTANVWQLTGSSPRLQAAAPVSASTRNGFLYSMPAYSVSVLVPR
ncbi:MAG: glycoside hydrolase family 44 protein [Myxococcales bacterium]|nr:glycoside hydrolase family 44 protein [Myxococcales bacterium]